MNNTTIPAITPTATPDTLLPTPLASEIDLEKLSDGELLQKCQAYGLQVRMWRDRFLGLLPEVLRRELYRAKGFDSIVEFAGKLGGVSKAQVERVLGTEEALRDKPVLHQMLISGEVSVNKLARIRGVATPENERDLAEQVKLLPKAALETLVKDMKEYDRIVTKNTDKSDQNTNTSMQVSFVPGHGIRQDLPKVVSKGAAGTGSFTLTEQAQQKLQELHDKGIDISEFIIQAIAKREEGLEKEIERLAQETDKQPISTDSRYIPKKTRDLLKQKYGIKCAIPHCKKPSQEIHHTARFALSKSHNPLFLAPLCKDHHKIAHTIDQTYQEKRKL